MTNGFYHLYHFFTYQKSKKKSKIIRYSIRNM